MHFLLAVVLVFLALLISPVATSAPVISAPATCLAADATKACASADSGSPAQAAGLKAGDRLISVGGTQDRRRFAQLRDAIRADKNAAPLAVTYERGGTVHTTTVTPFLQTQPSDSGGTEKVPVLGITAQQTTSGAATAARKTITSSARSSPARPARSRTSRSASRRSSATTATRTAPSASSASAG